MPLIDSSTGNVIRGYTVEQLRDAARLMRGYDMVALCAAGSGHAGGTLSIMDITAALYLHAAHHDPSNPAWPDRDRIVWSAGHKAPSLYLGLAFAGFCALEDVVTLRKLGSPFQGHPHCLKLSGVEVSTGSLGQGLSISVGMALAARLDGRNHKIFCLMGDGEQQEGQVWEAAMEAGHYNLDNLIAVIDCNRLQIDGWVKDVMEVEPLADKYESFGWNVISVDGHNMEALVAVFEDARQSEGKPVVILADTVKGKGVSFMENQAGWHGKVPNREELTLALRGLRVADEIPVERLLERAKAYQAEAEQKLEARMPHVSRNYWWNASDSMKVAMEPTRKGLGQSLAANGGDERVVCLGLDISGSITISDFYAGKPERASRWLSMGIAEQSATSAAAGLAREGKLPVVGSYATFSAARNLDQIRVSVCYSNLNVLIVGAHAGVSVGPDGATHQALEDLFAMMGLPNMSVVVPCDVVEARKATTHLLLEQVGPKYIRFAREATPIVTADATPFVFGKANRIRLRHQAANFAEAFETRLDEDCRDEGEDLTIIACGPEVPEAMRAAWILRQEYGYATRILNMHTLKPIDREAIVRAALETGAIVTAEEHQIGALAGQVSLVLTETPRMYGHPIITAAIGIKDRFGDSGAPWELVKELEVSAEHIAVKAAELMAHKREPVGAASHAERA
ncbi:transketolase [Occallatibacter riparius]|uniref:Transketolase n=1 Tax=Occallatibacter riparius TaxID=1002689 RepID=A0A9J7BSI9_9BACT|nr:transketolase [Occallatibacter riparius]UWZ83997.1 transketolase [Occallatibacter riparius]